MLLELFLFLVIQIPQIRKVNRWAHSIFGHCSIKFNSFKFSSQWLLAKMLYGCWCLVFFILDKPLEPSSWNFSNEFFFLNSKFFKSTSNLIPNSITKSNQFYASSRQRIRNRIPNLSLKISIIVGSKFFLNFEISVATKELESVKQLDS